MSQLDGQHPAVMVLMKGTTWVTLKRRWQLLEVAVKEQPQIVSGAYGDWFRGKWERNATGFVTNVVPSQGPCAVEDRLGSLAYRGLWAMLTSVGFMAVVNEAGQSIRFEPQGGWRESEVKVKEDDVEMDG